MWDTLRLQKETALARTAYKWKDRKVNLVDVTLSDGVNPQGRSFVQNVVPPCYAGKTVTKGSRLMDDWLEQMKIGGSFLMTEEHSLFIDILFEFEGMIEFEDSEMYCLCTYI